MRKKLLKCFVMSFLAIAMMIASASVVSATSYVYGDDDDYVTVDKITHPDALPGEVDGIDGDRLNSYAWAMAERNDYIYIGTNRAFISQQVYTTIHKMGGTLGAMAGGASVDDLYDIFDLATYKEFSNYLEMTDEDAIPEIIKVNPETGETVVLELPNDFKKIATKGEGCAFRSVVEVDGILYFGSYSTNYVFILRVDQNDKVTIAYMAGGQSTGENIQYNSLRANAYYDGKLYFGGTSSDLDVWENDPNKNEYVPLFIGEMKDNYDPDHPTSITFDNLIGDYRDFKQFASPKDPSVGNEFYDLVEYKGEFYVIISDSVGFAVYKGHPAKDGEEPNAYGWNWTLIVDGDDPQSPSHGYIAATPYIYKDKLYMGTFSNVGAIAQTGVQIAMWAFTALNGNPRLTLKQALTPLNQLLNTTPSLFEVVDDELVNVDSVTQLLKGKCNVYLWRFMEYNGDLYMSTYDASVMERYVLDISFKKLIETYLESLCPELHNTADIAQSIGRDTLTDEENTILDKIIEEAKWLEDILNRDDISIEDLEEIQAQLEALKEAMEELPEIFEDTPYYDAIKKVQELIESLKTIFNSIDMESLQMLVSMHQQVKNNVHGFDLLRTSDGTNWEMISDDGFGDMYNWGGRTFVNYNGSLYVGTANPFYGAQLWKLTDPNYTEPTPVDPEDPTPVTPVDPEDPTPVTPADPEDPASDVPNVVPEKPVNTDSNQNTQANQITNTSDSMNPVIWVSLIAISCGAVYIILRKRHSTK